MAVLVAEPAAAVRTYFEEKRLKNKIQDMVLADIVDHVNLMRNNMQLYIVILVCS